MIEHPKTDALAKEIRKEFPDFKVVRKTDSSLMRLIHRFLVTITFNSMQSFMTNFVTTVGNTVYIPTEWEFWDDFARYAVLRHERVHMRQSRRYGALLFKLLYIFVLLPGGYATFRTKFEQEAYEESMRALAEHHGTADVLLLAAVRDPMLKHFTSSEYFWMCPFQDKVERWYDGAVERIRSELV